MRRPILAATLVLCIARAFAQPAAAPAFEAASVKPSKEEAGSSSWNSRPGYLAMHNQTLRALIGIAYQVKDRQLSGGPKWLDSDRFDIEARAAGPARDPQLLAMLQTLLAERFQVALHHESRVFPTYALVVAKGGLKIRPVEGGGGSSTKSGRGRIATQRISMARLADALSRLLDNPVVDMTGVTGVFDFTLEWAADSMRPPSEPGADVPGAALGPSLFTVLQDQLGLKLEARKLPADVLIIDRAEKPSEN